MPGTRVKVARLAADQGVMLELLGLLTLAVLGFGVAALCSALRSRIVVRGDELRFDPDDVSEIELRFDAVLREQAREL